MKSMEYEQEDDELSELVEDFKSMVRYGNSRFFDSDELELIIENLMDDCDMEYAGKAIDYALRLYPATYEFKIFKVKRLIMEMEYDSALKELDDIERNYTLTAEFYMEKVLFSKMTGADQNSLQLLIKAHQLEPQNPDINFSLACEYVKKSLFNKGVFSLTQALKEDETLDDQLFTFSFLFEESQNYTEAIHFFEQLTDNVPLCKGAWFALGLAYSWNKEYEKAIDAYLFAISLDETSSTAYFNIGNAYYEMNDFSHAAQYYSETLRIEPEDFHALSGIGDCYYAMKAYPDALEYYRRAFHINRTFPDAIIGIISVLNETNRSDEAEDFIYLAFKNKPQGFELLFSVLPFYEDEKQIAKLKELFHLSIKQLQNKEDFLQFFTIYCAINDDLRDMGIEVLEEYLDNDEVTFVIPYFLAALHYLNQNFESANNYLKTALLINYEGANLFLSIHPKLEEIPVIQELITTYKPN